MKKLLQRTIKQAISYEGMGLFSGQKVNLSFRSAPPDTGVTFVRVDLPERPKVGVTVENAVTHYRRTSLEQNGVAIETVEHLLAALAGLGIDNLEIELNAPEIPVTDGSARPFVEILNQVGLVEQAVPKKYFVVKNPIPLIEKDASLIILPPEDQELTISYTLSYEAPLIGTQHLQLRINEHNFTHEIAPARTFCLASEVNNFIKQGLGKGANYQNTLVINHDKIIENSLRFKDEFVRHKILDLLGDLYLLNTRLMGRIWAVKTGHEHNIKLITQIARSMAEAQTGTVPKMKTWLDVRELQKVLPHRYPFLMLDKVIELEGYQRAVGIKNVTINEPYFQGHFPGQPIMPGVLQIEAMAQLAGALMLRRAGNENKLAVLLSLDKIKFRKSVVPGDQMRIEAEIVRIKSRTGLVYARSLVDGELASEAEIKFMLVDTE